MKKRKKYHNSFFKKLKYFLKLHLYDIPRNKKLIKKYPFLDCYKSSIAWDIEVLNDPEANLTEEGRKIREEDLKHALKNHYHCTFLDDMPDGWRKTFGIEMCEAIKKELIRCNFLDKYSLCQVKEKYGTLRWYDNGTPADSRIDDIISYYEDLSMAVCINCGKPTKYYTTGWITYVCEDCFDKISKNDKEKCRLTWADIPYREFSNNGKTTRVESAINFKEIWPEK